MSDSHLYDIGERPTIVPCCSIRNQGPSATRMPHSLVSPTTTVNDILLRKAEPPNDAAIIPTLVHYK